MFAWSCGVKSVITKIDSPTYEKLLNKVNIDVTISPAVISVNNIVRFIRNQSIPNDGRDDIDCMYKIAGGLAEAVEFSAYDNFRGKDIAFKSEQFKMKKDMIVAAIIRGDTVFVPDGMSQIHTGDKVIVVTGKNSKLSTLNDILS